jgi:Domain of unknown function (DUF1929)/Glyoxal oxidase N-terminus/PKD domain
MDDTRGLHSRKIRMSKIQFFRSLMAAAMAATLSRGGIRRAVTLLTISLGVLGAASEKALAQAQVTGQWVTLSYPMPINPIHMGLLHTGKVLVVAGSENDPTEHKAKISKAAVWDLGGGNITQGTITRTPDLTWDVFCNGWAFFPDGRCLVIGGTAQYDPFHGDPRTTVFDPLTEKFSQMQYMAHGRWYATGIVLPDGRIMAFSGLNETGVVDNQVELYTVGSGWSSPFTAPYSPNLYPWLHVLPDGRVFNSGGSPYSDMFNPSTQTWTVNFRKTSTGLDRTYGNSVLLPLLPPNYAARVMILGGGVPNATATTEIIDFSKSTPAWVRMGNMPSGARVEGNSVLLPNGKVLVQGGSRVNNDGTTATLGADLFDPATGAWSSTMPGGAGFAKFARMYHSVALLLPDATVATAGSNPQRGTWDKHIEIYSPAYLFNADGSLATRPVITSAPLRIGYNSVAFTVQTPDALNIGSVVLVKPGSDTHAFDMEQRLLGLTFTAASGALTVNAPPNSNLAPPGYYLLFVLNRAGVPSVARFVQVSPNPTDQPPKGTITAPTGNVTITAGQSVKFAGTASDADGSVQKYSWFFPEGTPDDSSVPSPGTIVFPTAGTYVASLTAVDDKGVNDPSPPTRTVTVQPTPTATPTPTPSPTPTPGPKIVQQVGPVTYGGSTSSMTVSLKQPPKQGDTLVVNASPTSVSGVSITGGGDTFTQTSPGVWTASNIVGLTWTPSVTVKWSAAVNNPSVTITEETP